MARGAWWWGAGFALAACAALAASRAPQGDLAGLTIAALLAWTFLTVVVLLWRLWRWMTYRVGARLLISYVLIGTTPVLSAAAFIVVGLYILMGQYLSVRYSDRVEQLAERWTAGAEAVARAADRDGVEAALAEAGRLSAAWGIPGAGWMVRTDGEWSAGPRAAEIPAPVWIEGPARAVIAGPSETYRLVAEQVGDGTLAAVLLPLDAVYARAVAEPWYQVRLANVAGDDVTVEATAGEGGVRVDVGGGTVAGELWEPWDASGGGLLEDPVVVWWRSEEEARALVTGDLLDGVRLISLLRSSPSRIWDDFVRSEYELGVGLRAALLGTAGLFLVLHALALAMAAVMIVAIARSTARLTHGAREVAAGNLGHRIPVRRRDQLGDLAVTFNSMTESVERMLAEIGEKEKITRELELAREIQLSLLPASTHTGGPFDVRAMVRPAAAVGGDYYDLFELPGDRLLVAVGDVAGHGLPTGIVMALLKASVAALVEEGHRGEPLFRRVDRLLTGLGEQGRASTLATFELDGGEVVVTSAAHPPAYVLRADGTLEELLAGALPLGRGRCEPRRITRPFGPGDRVVIYSDGVVEAYDVDGEPFGYDRLARTLERSAGLGGDGLIAAVLGEVDSHRGAAPVEDDLTLLVVEHARLGGPDPGASERWTHRSESGTPSTSPASTSGTTGTAAESGIRAAGRWARGLEAGSGAPVVEDSRCGSDPGPGPGPVPAPAAAPVADRCR